MERAAARSSLHASLFCLMEALGESVEPPVGTLAKWRQCVEDRLPQTLRDLRRQPASLFADAARSQLLEAKKDCEAQLAQIETRFTPIDIHPNRMLVAVEGDYAGQRANEALMAIDNTLRVWDLERRTCLAVFTCDASVLACAWAEARILAWDGRGQVHLFAWEE